MNNYQEYIANCQAQLVKDKVLVELNAAGTEWLLICKRYTYSLLSAEYPKQTAYLIAAIVYDLMAYIPFEFALGIALEVALSRLWFNHPQHVYQLFAIGQDFKILFATKVYYTLREAEDNKQDFLNFCGKHGLKLSSIQDIKIQILEIGPKYD